MHHHRCLLIACVTLSHACDSKDRSQPPSAPAPKDVKALELAFDGDTPTERMFAALQATPVTQFVLVVRGEAGLPLRYASTAVPDGPGMVVTIARDGTVLLWSSTGREGTPDRPKLATVLDEPGKTALRTALGDIARRTGAKQIDVVIDRAQPVKLLAGVVRTIRPAFADVRVAAGVPTVPSRVKVTYEELPSELRASVPSIEHCISESVKRDPPTLGYRITIEITVGTAGDVLDAAARGAQVPPLLAECLTKAALTWNVKLKPGKHLLPVDVKVE